MYPGRVFCFLDTDVATMMRCQGAAVAYLALAASCRRSDASLTLVWHCCGASLTGAWGCSGPLYPLALILHCAGADLAPLWQCGNALALVKRCSGSALAPL